MAQLVVRDLWRIPGLISLSRVLLAALFIGWRANPLVAIGVLSLAAISDVADGWFARRLHQETPTGRVLDPITDKIFVGTVVIVLVTSRTVSFGEAMLLAMREICEVPVAFVLMRRRQPEKPIRGANRFGKVATVMQFAAVAAILLNSPHRSWWVMSTAFFGCLAGLSYVLRERRHGATMG